MNISGNEDLCYYNSLCSHPWRVSNSLTLSSLNNIISNIGYFVLGFLFILIAYRRRTIYRAFEEVNRELAREKRMGVPQYFGIYYAIGEAKGRRKGERKEGNGEGGEREGRGRGRGKEKKRIC